MTFKPTGIEKFVCSEWSGWDELDCGVWMFYDPKVHNSIIELIDDERKVSYIVVDTQKCKVDFYFENEDYKSLDFKLQF